VLATMANGKWQGQWRDRHKGVKRTRQVSPHGTTLVFGGVFQSDLFALRIGSTLYSVAVMIGADWLGGEVSLVRIAVR
jgi:hypothetical protein